MKQFSISKAALRILSQQLQARGDGFTIKQLRILDKVVTTIDEKIGEYNEKLDGLIEQAKLDLLEDEKRANEINAKLNEELDQLTETEGKQEVKVILEDAEYNFAKEIWDNMAGYRGNSSVRKLVIEADDAINKVIDVTVGSSIDAKKNGDEGSSPESPEGGTAN